jgi:hypothetical protein
MDRVEAADHPISYVGRAAEISSRSNSCSVTPSIQTTERYLGTDQEIANAVNDNLGL